MDQKEVQEVMPVNRRAKDTFFKKVYETEGRQRELVAFLLGIKGEKVSTANVRPVLFGNKENDLALLCNDILYLMMEEQASVSPNVPYRLLEYVTAGLRSMVDSEQLLYGKGRVYFPVPKLYMLQLGLERKEEQLPGQVQYDIRLSDSYLPLSGKGGGKAVSAIGSGPVEAGMGDGYGNEAPDLDAVVHVYDFRMLLDEILMYIERDVMPDRFLPYNNGMRDYALVANGITYMQRLHKDKKYLAPSNVATVAGYLGLMLERGIFVDLLSDKEVVDMTMAQFSRDDILIYQGREEGREEGRIEGTIRTYKELGLTPENARHYIMDKYQKSKEEADEFMEIYWR